MCEILELFIKYFLNLYFFVTCVKLSVEDKMKYIFVFFDIIISHSQSVSRYSHKSR